MNDTKFKIGLLAQLKLEELLINKKYKIIARNWRYKKSGEIDLIVINPKKDRLIFIEVKMRKSRKYGDGIFSVNYKKQQRIKRLSKLFLTLNMVNYKKYEVRYFVCSYWLNTFKFYEF